MKQKAKRTFVPNYNARFIALFVLLGVVLMAGALWFGIEYSRNEAQNAMNRNTADLKKQIISYSEFLASNEVKSLIHLTEQAEDISETLAMLDENSWQTYLESSYDSQRLSCILVLNENLEIDNALLPVGNYSTAEECYKDWKDELQSLAVKSVLEHPQKLYSVRLSHGENDTYDIAVVARTDAAGVVFCVSQQKDEKLELHYSPVKKLLAQNETSLKGTLCITENGKIIATNQDRTCTTIEDMPELLALQSQGANSTLTRFVSNDSIFYGGIVKCQSYDIYAFYPADAVYTRCRTIVLVAFAVYILVALVVSLLYFKSRERHARDINQQQQEYQAKLEAAMQSEQQANQSKTDFLRRMSHDVRTPINVILGMLEIGSRNPTNTELLNSCRAKAKTAAEYLLELVNDILTLNKMNDENLDRSQASQASEASEIFCLRNEVQKVHLIATARIKGESGVTLESPQLLGEDKPLVGESLYLRQIMMNIITNAMRYSKPGGRVRVSVFQAPAQDREGCAEVRFVCEDNGIGMSKEFQQTMFEPFAQESTLDNSRFDGVGLGLSIVQTLVNRLHGTIEVQSDQGCGTRFEITIFYPYADMSSCTEAPVEAGASLQGLTVLVVEDNELNMEIAEFMVKEAGAHILKAENGAQAVEKFAVSALGEIDMILTDVVMPEMDGLEETRQIRALDRPDAKTVPIVAMTANLFEQDILDYTNAGMTGVLPKPLSLDRLIEVLAQQIAKGKKSNE